ncbi:hypothetical protein [uncultured Nostoc sp.]
MSFLRLSKENIDVEPDLTKKSGDIQKSIPPGKEAGEAGGE